MVNHENHVSILKWRFSVGSTSFRAGLELSGGAFTKQA
jgi:hypothetical protein